MAMKLFAHVLRSEFSGAGAGEHSATVPDSSRWAFRDLVVRRDGYAPWGLSRPAVSGADAPRGDPAVEPHWPDTQPCWHE